METKIIPPNSTFTFTVTEQEANVRLDVYLSAQFPHHSRTFLQKMVEKGLVTIAGKPAEKSNVLVKKDDVITVYFPEIKRQKVVVPPTIGAHIIFEHPHFFIVYKPPFLNVHAPEHGHEEVTLVDWLLTHMPELATVGCNERPGIVHRLDKDTSGLLVVPKNNYAHALFGDKFKNRQMHKTYYALVHGHPPAHGTIMFPIGRHQTQRHKMTHFSYGHSGAREAVTHYRVAEYFKNYALLELKPVTGRTHQLRVHCAALGHPIVGDSVYGTTSKLIKRQALHAAHIAFEYEGEQFSFSAPLPEDFAELVEKMRLEKN